MTDTDTQTQPAETVAPPSPVEPVIPGDFAFLEMRRMTNGSFWPHVDGKPLKGFDHSLQQSNGISGGLQLTFSAEHVFFTTEKLPNTN